MSRKVVVNRKWFIWFCKAKVGLLSLRLYVIPILGTRWGIALVKNATREEALNE